MENNERQEIPVHARKQVSTLLYYIILNTPERPTAECWDYIYATYHTSCAIMCTALQRVYMYIICIYVREYVYNTRVYTYMYIYRTLSQRSKRRASRERDAEGNRL